MDFTSNVLARPGAPVIKQCPPENSASRICSTTSFWPTITLASSVSMRARPLMSFSTACASLGAISGAVAVSTNAFRLLMGHEIENNIDAERITALFRELMEKPVVLALAFPGIAVVGIVRGNHHDASLVVQ